MEQNTETEKSGSKNGKRWNRAGIIPEILLGVLILTLCLVHAKISVHNADFGPLNGTFQDYNPIRRFLDGQVPSRDFSDYLGLGHLYLGTAATVLFGKTFTASKTAFVFLAFFSLSLFSLCLGMAVLKSRKRGLMLTGILLSLLLIGPEFLDHLSLSGEVRDAFQYALKNGNSARMVRGFILPLFCLVLITVLMETGRTLQGKRRYLLLFLYAFCSGFALPWSNDYGISLFLCAWIMFTVFVFARTWSVGKTLLLSLCDLIGSLLSAALLVEIFTLGNLPAWLHTTFGIGGFQRWYPNTEKHFYVFSIDLTWTSALQLLLCCVYVFMLFRERGSNEAVLRYGIPCLANLTGFCGLNEYYMISGDFAREVPLIILGLTLFYESFRFVCSLFSSHDAMIGRALSVVSILCMFSWLIPAVYDEFIYQKMTKKEGTYIPQLGGNVTTLGKSLTDTAAWLGGEKIFSTYASAMELVTGQFHPSGTDYIIHVMGDENRENYLQMFKNGDFRYAVTIQQTYSPWEYYIQRSNWFFYRELYRNWHPVFSNQYQVYWERNGEEENHIIRSDQHDITVEIEQNESTEAKLIVRTDPGISGFADVLIDYDVRKNGTALSKLMFQRMLYISEDKNSFSEIPFYGTNYLRSANAEYIPVTIVDGYGEILLSSLPKENTNLVISNASCQEIFTAPLDFVEIIGIGYKGETPYLRIPKIPQSRAVLSGADEILLGEYTIPVLGQAEDADGIMILTDLEGISFGDLEQFIGERKIASAGRNE